MGGEVVLLRLGASVLMPVLMLGIGLVGAASTDERLPGRFRRLGLPIKPVFPKTAEELAATVA